MRGAYPVEVPTEEMALLWDRIRGREVPPGALTHAAWVVAGYCLGQNDSSRLDSKNEAAVGQALLMAPDYAQAAPILEGMQAGAIPISPDAWKVLLKLALWVLFGRANS